MVNDKWFESKNIPLDRNDEQCSVCGGGNVRPFALRELNETHTQLACTCNYCQGIVIVIQEEKTEMCPTCGEPNAITKTYANELQEKQKKELNKILAWFEKYRPSGEECFYQFDSVNLALPELGVACFNFLMDTGLYKAKLEDET